MLSEAPPSSILLGYISSEKSPTRTRSIAAFAALLIGLLYLVPTIWLGWSAYADSSRSSMKSEMWSYVFGGPPPSVHPLFFHSGVPAPPPPTRTEILKELLADLVESGHIFVLALLVLAITSIIVSPAIRRGRRIPCYIMTVVLIPTFLIVMGLGGIAAFFTMNVFVSVGNVRMEPVYLLLAIPAAIAILFLCLLIDLAGYLRWIARQSEGEKPPRKFV